MGVVRRPGGRTQSRQTSEARRSKKKEGIFYSKCRKRGCLAQTACLREGEEGRAAISHPAGLPSQQSRAHARMDFSPRLLPVLSRLACSLQMPFLVFSCLALVSPLPPAQGKGGFKCSAGISKHICLLDNYSKFELPITEGVNEISVTIDIDEVLRINDKDYSITFATYFNVEWTERRLFVDPELLEKHNNKSGPLMVPMNLEFVKDLWLPNIFIYNLKTYKVIDVLSKLAGLWIDTNKLILYSQATHISFICPMSFDKFPLDEQRCMFRVGSYSYDSSKMVFIAKRSGYNSKDSNSIALDYDISITTLAPEDSVLDYGALGNFSLSGFEMVSNPI